MAPVVFCWCLFYLLACNSPVIGDKILQTKTPGLPLVNDTVKLRVLSVYQNMVSASGVQSTVLGSIYDPNFGSMYAGFYAQFGLASTNVYFGPGQGLDSVVLTLQYNGYYGNATPEPVDVYVYLLNLNQGLVDTQKLLYSTLRFSQGEFTAYWKEACFVPYNVLCGCPNDSVPILGVNYPQHLRVPLSAVYGDSILFANANVLSSPDSFFAIFRGLYVTVNTGKHAGNGIEYFDLTSVISGVTVYYHNTTGGGLTFTLPVVGASINHFDNKYSGTPAYAAISKPPTNGGSEPLMYVQAGGGNRGANNSQP